MVDLEVCTGGSLVLPALDDRKECLAGEAYRGGGAGDVVRAVATHRLKDLFARDLVRLRAGVRRLAADARAPRLRRCRPVNHNGGSKDEERKYPGACHDCDGKNIAVRPPYVMSSRADKRKAAKKLSSFCARFLSSRMAARPPGPAFVRPELRPRMWSRLWLTRQVGSTDSRAERRAHGPAPHHIHLAPVAVNGIAVPRKAAALELEADQLPGNPPGLLRPERGIAGEGAALVQLHDPAEPGLKRRRGVVDLVAVERVAHLQPERVAGAEADRLSAGLDQRLPDLHGVPLAAVQLESVLAGVAGAGDEALGAGDAADGEMIVGDSAEWRAG